MNRNLARLTPLMLAVAGVPLVFGCSPAPEDAASIGAALEAEDGGFDELPELPAFGLDGDLEADGRLDGDLEVRDPMAEDRISLDMRTRPDTAAYDMHLEWGQFPLDPDAEPYLWSGRFSVNRGVIIVRRVTRFEVFDHLRPRTDPSSIEVVSRTVPHHDGITITVLDPTPFDEEPLVLTYVRAADAATAGGAPDASGAIAAATVVPVASLLERPRVIRADGDNRMVAGARRDLFDRCEQGFMAGRWHRLEEGRGAFLGRVVSARGELRGHVRGIYGVRSSGERVFFGKYINLDGEPRGILSGTYADGAFHGRWVHRSAEMGTLNGRYQESIPGPETGGHFVAHWSEVTCDR